MFFTRDREALLVERPNRFVIIARDSASGELLTCHCPNPGRLLEFVFPGMPLILEKRGDNPAAKTRWTAAAVRYGDSIVPLFSSRANGAAEQLILKHIIPGLVSVRPEFRVGDSRFDFLCEDSRRRRHLVEVKSCSLVAHGTAMFPDAPSERAIKHLRELAALRGEGYTGHVLFVVNHGSPSRFIPNLHTSPAFASELSRLSGTVRVHAALVHCTGEGEAVLVDPALPVDLSFGALAAQNRGSYLVIFRFDEDQRIQVGALGEVDFPRGWYAYAGSAQKNLSQRLARHLRRTRKNKHWHVDYLIPFSTGKITALPVMTARNEECRLAAMCRDNGGKTLWPGKRIGASDCSCASHLLWFPENPLRSRGFVDDFLRFRHAWLRA
ncbi:MAG: DNA/RNA nuclease SfsA [Spirochaetaceae bacterium]|jgi:sugar fermentation stimulation protein A|nr:DNA/RNA nuclease SfsA [Spirochaetaceae bacterium]